MNEVKTETRGRPRKERKVFDPNVDAVALASAIEEAVIAKEKVKLYQESLSDIKSMAKDDLGIDTKTFNQLLKLRFDRSRDEFEEVNEELLALYDSAFKDESND